MNREVTIAIVALDGCDPFRCSDGLEDISAKISSNTQVITNTTATSSNGFGGGGLSWAAFAIKVFDLPLGHSRLAMFE